MTNTSRLHVRRRGVKDVSDVVELIDRFLDEKLEYSMEWDDFISWKQEDSQLEEVRQRIGRHETLLFSAAPDDRQEYISLLIEERNRIAAQVGQTVRQN